MAIKLSVFDPTKYIETPEDIEFFLGEAMKTNDPGHIAAALGCVARAKGMTTIAKEVGVTREHLYTALSSEGNPAFGTILRVLNAFGYELRPIPKNPHPSAA